MTGDIIRAKVCLWKIVLHAYTPLDLTLLPRSAGSIRCRFSSSSSSSSSTSSSSFLRIFIRPADAAPPVVGFSNQLNLQDTHTNSVAFSHKPPDFPLHLLLSPSPSPPPSPPPFCSPIMWRPLLVHDIARGVISSLCSSSANRQWKCLLRWGSRRIPQKDFSGFFTIFQGFLFYRDAEDLLGFCDPSGF